MFRRRGRSRARRSEDPALALEPADAPVAAPRAESFTPVVATTATGVVVQSGISAVGVTPAPITSLPSDQNLSGWYSLLLNGAETPVFNYLTLLNDLDIEGNLLLDGPLTIGESPGNALTITPGVTESSPIVVNNSGSGSLIFQIMETVEPIVITGNTILPTQPAHPSTAVRLIGQTGNDAVFDCDTFGVGHGGGGGFFMARGAQGTPNAPLPTIVDQRICGLRAGGYGTTNYALFESAAINLLSAEAFTDTAWGGYIRFDTTQKGTAVLASERMRLTDVGNLLIGTTIDNGARLQVAGSGVTQSPAGLSMTNNLAQIQNTDGSGTFFVATAINAGGVGYRSYNALGTSAAPAAPTSGALLMGAMQCGSFDGSVWAIQAAENFQCVGAWTPTSHPTQINWQTTPVGSTTVTQAMTLLSSGALQLNVGGLGVFGIPPPVARPSITGSRGSATVAVLTALLTALAATGLITDGTTA